MFIKEAGTYIALCDEYCLIFRAVGAFPFFRIPTGIVLNDYIKGGEIRTVKETEVEIQGLISHPEKYAITSLDEITDNCSLKGIDIMTTGVSTLGSDVELKYTNKLKDIDKRNSGLHINSLIMEIVREENMSLPQARMVVCMLRKRIKDEINRTNRTD